MCVADYVLVLDSIGGQRAKKVWVADHAWGCRLCICVCFFPYDSIQVFLFYFYCVG